MEYLYYIYLWYRMAMLTVICFSKISIAFHLCAIIIAMISFNFCTTAIGIYYFVFYSYSVPDNLVIIITIHTHNGEFGKNVFSKQ